MDIDYLVWLQGVRESANPVFNTFMSLLGGKAVMAIALFVPCLFYWCLDKQTGIFAVLSYGTSSLFNQLLKNTVCCYRPWVRDARVKPVPSAIKAATGYSFPSAHTQGTGSVVLALGWSWRKRVWPLIAGVLFMLLIGFSRNYLGVHAPQDVLVGIIESCVFVWLAEKFLRWVDGGLGRDARALAVSIVAIAVYLLYVTIKSYPMDYVDGQLLVDPHAMLIDCYKVAGVDLGLIIGWFCERRFVNFSTDKVGLRQAVLRMLVGAALVGACFLIGKYVFAFMGALWGQLVRYFLSFLVAMIVVPIVFERLECTPKVARWIS